MYCIISKITIYLNMSNDLYLQYLCVETVLLNTLVYINTAAITP